MSQRTGPRLAKWPFFVADVVLLGAAAWIVFKGGQQLSPWALVSITACTAIGAWVCVTPFLKQHQADLQFAEADKLAKLAGKSDKLRFYNTAQASLEECRYQLILARDLRYADPSEHFSCLEEVSRLLEAYMKSLRRSWRTTY